MALRFTTAGESHGPGLTCIVEGLPAGLAVAPEDLDRDLARRQLGHGRGGRMKIESDAAVVTAGLRHGRTLGSPVALQVNNRDYANWEERMNPWPVEADVDEVHLPRPGHADLAGVMKFGHTDVRNVLERASARETAARVAAGGLAKAFLRALGVEVYSHVVQIGSVRVPEREDGEGLAPEDFSGVDESPVRCLDADTSAAMVEEINRLRKANESLGGIFEVRAFGLVPGLGSHVSWEERLDGRLAHAIVSIHAMKGVSVGPGFEMAGRPGSEVHDEIFWSDEKGWTRETNRAGGVEGGMTTGEPLIVVGAMKPLPTLTKPLRSVDISTREPAPALRERTDSTTVPAAGVVGEAMVALVLADAYRAKFGGDHIDDVLRRAGRLQEAHRLAQVTVARRTPALVFVGFMGAGKTTAARVADPEAIDTDELLERELGESVADFFEREGEEAFRAREEAVVLDTLDRAGTGAVALGGGSLGSARVREALAQHTVVHLEVSADEAWERVSGDASRPLARDRERFGELHAQRAPVYEAAADAVLPGASRAAIAAALPALRALAGAPAGTRMLWARAASGDHPVFVGAGLLEAGFFPLDGTRHVVSDTTVHELYGARLEPAAGAILVEPGERSKTLAAAQWVWQGLIRQGAGRDDLVVALGGGVVGDLAGFCAATYQRGIRVAHVPTTLVSQVDSAYGGKTGVDLPEAKNYVGAYHQPTAVLADTATLSTLPGPELAAGYAEVVKTALIAGGALWERVRDGAEGADPEIVLACARTKLAVVAQDERDAGLRQVLNLGHTVGHAIETATGYGRYRHGEAVGLGLLAALRLSGRDDLRAEVAELLRARGLPTRLEGTEPPAVLDALRRDKKRRADGVVPFVVVHAPGDVRPGAEMAPDDVEDAVRELLA